MNRPTLFLLSILFSLISIPTCIAQNTANYDESKVPDLILPDPFVSFRGKSIRTVEDWESVRRPEILQLFEENVYGKIPSDFDAITFKEVTENQNPYPEKAILKEVDITVSRNGNMHTMRLNVFIPKSGQGPFPIFMLINHRAKDPSGKLIEEGYWSVSKLIDLGYATASFNAETVAPDDKIRFSEGVIGKLYPEHLSQPDGMRTLGAWGWGAMRAMDYFVHEASIDEKRAILVGHSRSGKAALWASANDARWAVTISNESGCGGAALSKRKFGETVEVINTSFPHWFNVNFKAFNRKEELLPLDQHMMVSLIAPRAIYFSSAREDRWSDPKGEYLAMQLGSRVFSEIYGEKVSFQTPFGSLKGSVLQPFAGYHIREGEHNLTWEDWSHFVDFVEFQFNPHGKI